MYLMVEIKLKTILDDELAQTRKTSFCCKTLVETDIKPSSSKILPKSKCINVLYINHHYSCQHHQRALKALV